MAKIFITGSSDGLGLFTAQKLIEQGHEVTLHAKNKIRAKETILKFQKNIKILIADLSNINEVVQLANTLNLENAFDVIINNAGVYNTSKDEILKVNVLAPYILTALVKKPKKLIYIGSNMHVQGKIDLKNLSLKKEVSYSTSKLQILMLSLAVARKWTDVEVNTIDPGWVKTKMANYNAPDTLEEGSSCQIWLSSNNKLRVTGKYFYHKKEADYLSKAKDIETQEKLLEIYENLTGIHLQ